MSTPLRICYDANVRKRRQVFPVSSPVGRQLLERWNCILLDIVVDLISCAEKEVRSQGRPLAHPSATPRDDGWRMRSRTWVTGTSLAAFSSFITLTSACTISLSAIRCVCGNVRLRSSCWLQVSSARSGPGAFLLSRRDQLPRQLVAAGPPHALSRAAAEPEWAARQPRLPGPGEVVRPGQPGHASACWLKPRPA